MQKRVGQVDIIGNDENGIKRKKSAVEIKKLPAASNAVGSKRINKSVPFYLVFNIQKNIFEIYNTILIVKGL